MAKYTHPELRERLKEEIKNSSKGGRKGQWSARKAQLLTQAYEKHGGGYVGEKDERQKHLEKWTEEDWQTRDGKTRARRGDTTERYLPKEAWEELSEEEKDRTERRKERGSRRGQQFVSNAPAAKEASRRARRGRLEDRTKKDLYRRAQKLDISGRSKMNKPQLVDAIRAANR